MSNDIAKALKQKTDAMLRLQGQSQKPVVYENGDGSYTAPEKSDYTAVLAQGKNIKITTSGNIKTISAVMNILAGNNISVSAPDENGAVTITGTMAGKEVNVTDFTGKDGYSIVYDEVNDEFILSEVIGGGSISQATETVIGGVKAKPRTAESSEVAIDPDTGRLYAPASGGGGTDAESILGKPINIADFTGKNDYIIAFNETNGTFYLKKDEAMGGGGYIIGWNPVFYNQIAITTISKPI